MGGRGDWALEDFSLTSFRVPLVKNDSWALTQALGEHPPLC